MRILQLMQLHPINSGYFFFSFVPSLADDNGIRIRCVFTILLFIILLCIRLKEKHYQAIRLFLCYFQYINGIIKKGGNNIPSLLPVDKTITVIIFRIFLRIQFLSALQALLFHNASVQDHPQFLEVHHKLHQILL